MPHAGRQRHLPAVGLGQPSPWRPTPARAHPALSALSHLAVVLEGVTSSRYVIADRLPLTVGPTPQPRCNCHVSGRLRCCPGCGVGAALGQVADVSEQRPLH